MDPPYVITTRPTALLVSSLPGQRFTSAHQRSQRWQRLFHRPQASCTCTFFHSSCQESLIARLSQIACTHCFLAPSCKSSSPNTLSHPQDGTAKTIETKGTLCDLIERARPDLGLDLPCQGSPYRDIFVHAASDGYGAELIDDDDDDFPY